MIWKCPEKKSRKYTLYSIQRYEGDLSLEASLCVMSIDEGSEKKRKVTWKLRWLLCNVHICYGERLFPRTQQTGSYLRFFGKAIPPPFVQFVVVLWRSSHLSYGVSWQLQGIQECYYLPMTPKRNIRLRCEINVFIKVMINIYLLWPASENTVCCQREFGEVDQSQCSREHNVIAAGQSWRFSESSSIKLKRNRRRVLRIFSFFKGASLVA